NREQASQRDRLKSYGPADQDRLRCFLSTRPRERQVGQVSPAMIGRRLQKTTHEAPSLLCGSPRDHMKTSLDLKGFVRGLDPPMQTLVSPRKAATACHAARRGAAVRAMSPS